MTHVLRRSRIVLLAVGVAAIAGLTGLPAAAAGPPPGHPAGVGPLRIDTFASGLANPRGLAVGPGGRVFVAEAGRAGESPCVPDIDGPERCLSRTGAVTVIDRHGQQRRILSGLPALSTADGLAGAGPHDVAVGRDGVLFVAFGLHNRADIRADLGPDGAALGTVQRFGPDGRSTTVADLAEYELVTNPDGGVLPDGVNSNPYSLVLNGPATVVADASSNAVVQVGPNGQVGTLAVLPARDVSTASEPGAPVSMQSVPTTIVAGRDGAYYVGEFTGVPYPVDQARIYKLVPGKAPAVYVNGFTNIVDIAFDRHGRLYVLELARNGLSSGDLSGSLTRVDPDGRRTELPVPGLVSPTSVAVADDGTIYVTNHALSVDGGEVLRIRNAG